MISTPEKKAEVTYHPYAECTECVWQTDPGPEVRADVKNHVRKHGHSVRMITETVAVWAPKEREV